MIPLVKLQARTGWHYETRLHAWPQLGEAACSVPMTVSHPARLRTAAPGARRWTPRTWRCILLALVLTLTVASPAAHAASRGGSGIPDTAQVNTDGTGFAILRFERRLEAARPITQLRVRNPWGDVRIRRARTNAVSVNFVVQRLGTDAPLPDIDARIRGVRADIRIDYPGDPERVSAGGARPGRVDLVVFVPASAAIDATTDDGELRIAHTTQPVRARSSSGRIVASGAATLDIETGSGNILARQMQATGGRTRVRSLDGAVTVLFPADDVRLRARAGSGIEAGPGWTPAMALRLEPGATRLDRRWGEGRHRIDVESRNSAVYLTPYVALDDDAAASTPTGEPAPK
jgi:hypothetical protein